MYMFVNILDILNVIFEKLMQWENSTTHITVVLLYFYYNEPARTKKKNQNIIE